MKNEMSTGARRPDLLLGELESERGIRQPRARGRYNNQLQEYDASESCDDI